jgi:LmbE family N-acetylglucosaminyl deacetylase
MDTSTRRHLLSRTALASAALGLAQLAQAQPAAPRAAMKVIVVGGHPDDPESGAGGTMAKLADRGHDVAALYITRGEAGIRGKSAREAADIRTAECEKACRILKCRALFAGQVDGQSEITATRYDAFAKLLLAEKPDIVITHWPIDTHRDHRVASMLAYDAFLKSGRGFALYFLDVMTGSQSQNFRPTAYIDITQTEPRKREACFAHASQDPAGFYAAHDCMNRFRGMEHGCEFAEAFVAHDQNRANPMLEG